MRGHEHQEFLSTTGSIDRPPQFLALAVDGTATGAVLEGVEGGCPSA